MIIDIYSPLTCFDFSIKTEIMKYTAYITVKVLCHIILFYVIIPSIQGDKMTIAIYPGSFDPITNGHIDILKSGAEIFEKVIIAVAYNVDKEGFLPVKTRVKLIQESTKDIPNVEVDCFQGLTIEYAKKRGADVLLRGLRTSFDFEYEMQLSQTNQVLYNNIKTVFLITKPEYNFISSSCVREILLNKGDIRNFVPEPVAKYLNSKYDDIL